MSTHAQQDDNGDWHDEPCDCPAVELPPQLAAHRARSAALRTQGCTCTPGRLMDDRGPIYAEDATCPVHGTPLREATAPTDAVDILDDLIARWHDTAEDGLSLVDFLGVRREDYAAWVEGRMTAADLLASREEPHHRAARQPTDEERAAARGAVLGAMRAGLPKLAEKAKALSERHGGVHGV